MISFKSPKSNHSSGQALAEFAIIIVFLSMLMFFIVDAARLGWAWVTVQGAARVGARYASTGNASCQDPPSRLDCIVATAYNYMDTLGLHENPQAPWGSDNAYRIEVWGIDENNDGPWYDYPGAAGKSVVVRAYYWVPIIAPFLKPIMDNIPVYGQVTITNELFDSLGGASAGVGLPPPAPPIPPAQPTATYTPEPPTDTPEPPTDTPEPPTDTPEPPACRTQFEDLLIAGDTSVEVTGSIYPITSTVSVFILSSPPILIGTGTLVSGPDHDCAGYVTVAVSSPLVAPGPLMVVNDHDSTFDTELVLADPPTQTPEPPTPLPPPLPTATPSVPYIVLNPTCGPAGQTTITVEGHNWTESASPINLFWIPDGGIHQLNDIILAGHPADFVRIWQFPDVPLGEHEVLASSGSSSDTDDFDVPCENPIDLVISSPIVTTPPAAEHEAFDVQVVITNTGEIDTYQQFFVDIYLDPSEIYTDTIPSYQSDGYIAVDSLAGGTSKTLIIDVPFGFPDGIGEHREVWTMVDSLEQVVELDESNNIGGPTLVTGILTSTVGTPTPVPAGSEEVGGFVYITYGGPTLPQIRAQIWLVNDTPQVVATTFSDNSAYYQFTDVESGAYDVWACIPIGGRIFAGNLTGVVPTNNFADLLLEEVAGCPYYP